MRLRDLQHLDAALHALTACSNVDMLLSTLFAHIRELFQMEAALVWLGVDGERARLYHSEGIPASVSTRLQRVKLSVNGRRTIARRLRQLGYRTVLAVPLGVQGKTVGMIAASSQRFHRVGRMQTAIFHLVVQSAVHTLDRLQFSPWYADQEARPSATIDADMEVQAVRMYLLHVFVSGIIHDLNNAMAVISGRLDLLVHRLEDPVVSRHLLAAQHATLEANRLIRDLHSFMPGDHQGDMELVDINQLVRDSLQIAASNWFQEFRERRVSVDLRADLQPVPAFPSRASDMRIALLGLLRHAMDTLRPGVGLIVRTSVVEETEGQLVAVSIADEPYPSSMLGHDAGIGILLRQAQTAAGRLILEGVQAIVRDLAGQITVDQHSDGGTVTTLTFSVGRMSASAR